jgi:hypothetical protein
MRSKFIAALGICLLATACVTKYEPQYGPVPQTAAANQGRAVRLILKAGGAPVDIYNMRVEGDSIVGDMGNPPQRYAVATEEVQVIAVSEVDSASPINTAITTLGAIAIAIILATVLLVVELADELP